MENVIGQSCVSRAVFGSYPISHSASVLLIVVLSAVMAGFFGSTSWAESKEADRTPITVKELQAKFALSESIEQPVRIEGRVIEDTEDDQALTFLNGRLGKGHGIEIVNCEIKGDLIFVPCAGPLQQLEPGSSPALLRMPRTRRRMIQQAIAVEDSEIKGSLVGHVYRQGERTARGEFCRAIFEQQVTFSSVTCESATFEDSLFKDRTEFIKTSFGGDADFSRAKFLGYASFYAIKVEGDASFYACKFSQRGDFYFSEFKGAVSFDYTDFPEGAHFLSTKFSGHTSFWGAEFLKGASFSQAVFSNGMEAPSARFHEEASFDHVLFKGKVDFREALFTGQASFAEARFVTGGFPIKQPVRFNLCTFQNKTDFTNALFDEALILRCSIVEDHISFIGARFRDDLDLSGILVRGVRGKKRGGLSFMGSTCKDILFGVSQPSLRRPTRRTATTPAWSRVVMASGKPLHDTFEQGCFIDLTGAHYDRLLFLEWDKLKPAIEESLRLKGIGDVPMNRGQEQNRRETSRFVSNSGERSDGKARAMTSKPSLQEERNATLTTLRLLARNYDAVGSQSDALNAYAFYRQNRLQFQPSIVDAIISFTTGFGAKKERLLYCFLGLWLIPWALGYWRPGVVVAAKEETAPPKDTLWNWVGSQTKDGFLRQLRMIAYSLWFSFNMFVPAIEVFGFKRWAPSNGKILEVIPIRYYSLATVQRIMGWVLIPIAIAALAGLFGVK